MPAEPRTETNPRGDDINLRSAAQMREYELIVRRIRADRANRALSAIPGLNLVATNIELIARTPGNFPEPLA